jgi:hypothetical protein
LYELTHLPEDTNINLLTDLKKVVKCLAGRNKLLRERASSLELMEEKFKKLGGEKWKESMFYPVICSVRDSKMEIKEQVEDSLALCNQLAYYGVTMN